MELIYYKPSGYKRPSYYDCPHNEGCRCKTKDCYHCGWNPRVAAYRVAKLKRTMREKINGQK